MHDAIHWFQAAAEARAVADPHSVTYIDFLTVTLTALSVILTAVAVMIGVMAIWGYAGMKEQLTKTISGRADLALQAKLKEYPDAAEMIALVKRVSEVESIRALLLVPETNDVVPASSLVQDGTEGETLAKDYPPDLGK